MARSQVAKTAYMRKWRKTHPGYSSRFTKRWREAHPDRAAAMARRSSATQRLRHPQQAKARSAVSNAIQSGRLTKGPCEVCGELKVQAHHDDYSKPLDVRWLCRKHHGELHQE